ncbi:MAG: DUF1127 domain-containing protein [Gammaproteobacteria bacterium]|nr:DUF1127 domain-containing protein [Gammaproteobacteria bacterium]
MSARKEVFKTSGFKNRSGSAFRHFADQWARWSINFDTRKQLLRLEQHELDDIGLSREHALIEGRKPFWKD